MVRKISTMVGADPAEMQRTSSSPTNRECKLKNRTAEHCMHGTFICVYAA